MSGLYEAMGVPTPGKQLLRRFHTHGWATRVDLGHGMSAMSHRAVWWDVIGIRGERRIDARWERWYDWRGQADGAVLYTPSSGWMRRRLTLMTRPEDVSAEDFGRQLFRPEGQRVSDLGSLQTALGLIARPVAADMKGRSRSDDHG